MDFPDRLRAVIAGAKIDEFAQALDEPAQRVKDVLRGKQRPPFELLLKIHTRLGVDLNWLVSGEGEQPPSLSTREATLLANYRETDEEGQRSIERSAMLEAQRKASPVETARKKRAA